MQDLISSTIEKIKEKNIRPEPRWKYLAKKYSAWLAFFVLALIGSAVFSVAYFLITQLDWDIYTAHMNSLFSLLSLVPYIWIVPLILLAFLSFVALRKTESGYRYNFSKIAAAVLGIILVLGLVTASVGFGGRINGAVMHGFPGYGKLVATKESQWSQPGKGFLAGTINSVSKNSLGLQDFSGKVWQINTDEKTSVRPSVNLEPGEMIKTIGQIENGQNFKASEIRPWQGRGQMGKIRGTGNSIPNRPGTPAGKGMPGGR